MAKEILKIRIDNGLGNSNPTFKDIELDDYSGKFPRMGFPDLTATLMWPTPLDDEWTHREYVVLRGENFYVTDTPDAEKTNNSVPYKHSLGFTSEFARILGNTYFEDYVPDHSATYNKPCSNSPKFTFYGTIGELCDRLNCSFIKAGIADSILKTKTSLTTFDTPVGDGYCVMLDPYGADNVYDPNKTYSFEWEKKTHWEAITEGFNITEIPFERHGKCVVFGAVPKVLNHKFEYGHDNELLSIKHKNAKAKVINRITMLGSPDNIPYYYPNETEYGHIILKTINDNVLLNESNIEVVNISQLLARIPKDQKAVFSRYDDSNENGDFSVIGYRTGWDGESIEDYNIGDSIEKKASTGNYTIYWTTEVVFSTTATTPISVSGIKGEVWCTNQSSPANIIDITSLQHLRLREYGHDVDLPIQKNTNGFFLGDLKKGKYVLRFDIGVYVPKALKDTTHTIICRLYEVLMSIGNPLIAPNELCWNVGGKKYTTGQLGIRLNIEESSDMLGDAFCWEAIGRMPFQTNLVPPKYRNTLGAERFYNALNAPYSEEYASEYPDAYIDPDTNNPYIFPNPFIEGAPSEHIHKNEDIKPTIEGVTNASGQLLGVIADIAYDADDNDSLKADSTEDNDKNDSLKYEHSFFYIKLNIFNGDYGFDLFAHASQTDAMTIQMRDGSCNGCKFKIQAAKFTDETGLESYKNPIIVKDGKAVGVVSEDGIKESDLDPTQQNTQTHSIWICVQKDADTFGVIMPNKSNNFKPKIGDKFNIINIDLPQAYLLAAEKRLEEEGMRYMLDNNEEKFSFDISASRIFFAENLDVLAQLDEYSVIKVKYNGREYEQYVNQLSIECKSNEPLPNIGIDLTDTLAVGQSFVEQVAERASSLISNPYTMGGALGGGSGGGLTTRLADMRYLKKTEADRSKGKVASDVGFEVGEFVSGGSGAILFRDPETGQTYLEVDKIKARMKAIFAELEVAKEQSIGGKFDITPGGGIDISFVEETATSYRCYFKAKDEDKGADCRFVVGDQARCQESNIADGTAQNASNRYYWRLVTAVNNNESYIELSKTDCDKDSDVPMAGDTIVQLGNRNDPERQSAIVLSTVDAFAPCVTLYNGIDHYSLDGKAVVEYGVDKSKNPPEPFFNCYGRFFFGPKGGNSYLKFEPSVGKLIFSGELINITSLNGKDIDKYITDLIPEPDLSEYDYLKEAIKDGASVTKGGLYLGGLIMLGEWDTTDEENPIFIKSWSGLNGIRNHAKTIASWWGGPMEDKYYNKASITPRPTPLTNPDEYAAALVRMDGSAYFSGGNVGFEPDGSGWLAGNNITWKADGTMKFGSGIVVDLGGGDNDKTLSSLLRLVNNLSSYFVPVVKKTNGNIIEVRWDEISNENPLYAVKSVKGFYSDEFISAHGVNPNSGNGGLSFGRLDSWDNYNPSGTDALSAILGFGLKEDIENINIRIDNLPTTSVNPYALTIQKNGVALGTYDGSETKIINISDVASAGALSSHMSDTTIHITSSERTKWNTTSTNLDTILGSDANGVLNKWDEIVAFLDTYTEADTLANLLSNKADKATKINAGAGLSGGGTLESDRTLALATSGVTEGTYTKVTVDKFGRVSLGNNPKTLAGYGITDAYTKTDADNRYVNSDGDTMTGVLTLNAGAKVISGQKLVIGDCEITWDATCGGLKFSKGIYSEGYVSAHGANSNGSGSGGSSGVAYNRLDNWNDYATDKEGYVLSAKLGYDLYANKLNATKAAIEGLLTGNITSHTHSQYLTSHQSLNHIDYLDNRNANLAPYGDWPYKGFQYSLKKNTADGLEDGGTYHGSMTLHQWADSSGGAVHQLGFTGNGRIWHRFGSSSWSDWSKVAFTSDIPTKVSQLTNDSGYALSSALEGYLPLTGGTVTGPVVIKNGSVSIYSSGGSGDEARAFYFYDVDGNRVGGVGALYNAAQYQYSFIGWGNSPWGGSNSLVVSPDTFTYKNKIIWHAGNQGSGSGMDADKVDGVHGTNINTVIKNFTTSASTTGYVKIKFLKSVSYMLAFKILAYQGYTFDEINISGYNHITQNCWYKPSAKLVSSIGNSPTSTIEVTFGRDSDGLRWVAIPKGMYSAVSVTDVVNGNLQLAYDDIEITFVESLSGTLENKQRAVCNNIQVKHTTPTRTAGWWRIAELSNSSWGNVIIQNTWNGKRPQFVSLGVYYSHRGDPSDIRISQLDGAIAHKLYLKARIVYPDDATADSSIRTAYLEVWYDTALSNDVYINVNNGNNITLLSSFTEGSVPENYSTKEINLIDGGIVTGNINTTGTTLCKNLNADLLDGKHDGEITSILFNYNNAGLKTATYGTYGGFIQEFTDTPENQQWCNKLKILHHNSSGYYTELAMSFTGTEGVYYRIMQGGNLYDWKRLAFITDNVASATKLQDDSLFTAWGQTFFGNGKPSDVSGDLSDVGDINMSGSVFSQNLSADSEMGFIIQGKSRKVGFIINSFGTTKGLYDYHFGKWIVGSTGNGDTMLMCGKVGVNTLTPAYQFHVNGVCYASTGIFSEGYVSARGQNTSSDINLKTSISDFHISIDKIANAPSVTFKWKDNGKDDVGSIAQYWHKLSPLLTPDNPDGTMSLQYGKAALLSSISIANRVMSQEEQIKQLNAEIERLKERINQL